MLLPDIDSPVVSKWRSRRTGGCIGIRDAGIDLVMIIIISLIYRWVTFFGDFGDVVHTKSGVIIIVTIGSKEVRAIGVVSTHVGALGLTTSDVQQFTKGEGVITGLLFDTDV